MTIRDKLIQNLGKEVEIIINEKKIKAKINWVTNSYTSITLTKGYIVLDIKNIKEVC